MKNTLIALAIAISALPVFGTAPAEAGRCKQPLPFGGWTWVPCTAKPERVNKRSAPTMKRAKFYVFNRNNFGIKIQFKGQSYYVPANGHRWFKTSVRINNPYVSVSTDRWAGDGYYTRETRSFNPLTRDLNIRYSNSGSRRVFMWTQAD